jgi:hypothetical protein
MRLLKRIFICLLLFFCLGFSSRVQSKNLCVDDELIIHKIQGEIIYRSENFAIVKNIDSNGNFVYAVVGFIFNLFLPDVSELVCLQILGEENEHLCKTISDGIGFLTSLNGLGKQTFKMAKNFGEMLANRETSTSTLKFVVNTAKFAYDVIDTMEAYKKLGLIKWSNVEAPNELPARIQNKISIELQNQTKFAITLSFSANGVFWKSITINAGKTKDILFENDVYLGYGFVKGNSIFEKCNYQLHGANVYKILQNTSTQKYYFITNK